MRARRTRARTCCIRARARVRERLGAHASAPTRARAFHRLDRGWLGMQAFWSASAFNADIGAWNTAAVTTLNEVCGAFSARAARQCKRDALGGCSMRRGPLCAAATADARPRVCAQTCGRAHARVSACVGMAARRKDGLHVCMYMYVCIYMYMFLYVYIYIADARTCCVHARARVCVCDLARAHPRRHMRARAVGVDRGWPRLAGVLLGVGVQREHRRVEHRPCRRVVRGMRRLSSPALSL
jgi:hypothetical protein